MMNNYSSSKWYDEGFINLQVKNEWRLLRYGAPQHQRPRNFLMLEAEVDEKILGITMDQQ